MAEGGGPSTQSGIFYQNTVAARFLADLLNLHVSTPRETVVEVRVEAPSHVDDVVVKYADGHKAWIQAKLDLRPVGDAWNGLWESFFKQSTQPEFGADDRLVLALGNRGALSKKLQELAERASTAVDDAEWRSRIGVEASATLGSIEKLVPTATAAFQVLRTVDVLVMTQDELDTEFRSLDLGTASPAPVALQSHLRDMVGGAARSRGTFRAAPLRRALASDFGTDLFEPKDWGLAAYRETVRRACRIPIPGKGGVSAPAGDLIVWPRAKVMTGEAKQDFEDELPGWRSDESNDHVTLNHFPTEDMPQCILVAGPGFGKSTMISALSARLVETAVIPVEISLGDFALTELGVIEFMETTVNRDFSIHVAWQHLAERGLICVLFDGLDEVPTTARQNVIRRIRLFAARFTDVPWLLTVRDPAALSGPLDGTLVELLPFDNQEISELAEKFKRWSPQLDPWEFVNHLRAYPDVAKLARIPLFLSMLLGVWAPGVPLPSKRSDLIEKYLGILFDASKRRSVTMVVSDAELRRAAQTIAFDSLEREEIGISERQASRVLACHGETPPDTMLSHLTACGTLVRQSSGRLQFPYPIVQEYLAAVHIVDNIPEQLASRIGDVVKRPWAQVIQFALELLPDSSAHIRSMLERPDDAFSTGLRLIGRCIANGAVVEADLRHEIGSKLARLWETSHYNLRERVGRLVADAFSAPLHPEVARLLGRRWLLGSGAGEIVVAQADPELTVRVVRELLDEWLEMFMGLRPVSKALQPVATQVIEMAVERAARPGTTLSELCGVTDFFEAVRLSGPNPPSLMSLIEDDGMPLFVRLSARAARSESADMDDFDFVVEGLGSTEWRDQSAALSLVARFEDKVAVVNSILAAPQLSHSAKSHVLERLDRIFADKSERAFVAGAALPTAVDPRFRDILKVYLIRSGDRVAFLEMIDRLEVAEDDVVEAVLVSMNLFPEKVLGDLVLERIARRPIGAGRISSLVGSAVTGMTYSLAFDSWDSYGMDDAPLHPSWSSWAPQFDFWLAVDDLSRVERLRLLRSLVKYRPELLSEIQAIVFSAGDPDSTEWDEDNGGHVLRAGMDELRIRRVRIPLALAEAFARAKRPNLSYAGVAAIGAHTTSDALNLLIEIHRSVDRSSRASVFDEIELLAGRLGVVIGPADLGIG